MIKKLVSVSCAVAALSVGSSAFAAPVGTFWQQSNKVDSNISGNDNFWAMYMYQGWESISNFPGSVSAHRDMYTQQQLLGAVQVFGAFKTILVATARGEAEQYAPNDGSPGTNSRSAWVAVNFLGNVVYDQTSTTACGSTSYSSCASHGTSWEQTFFHAEDTFTVGVVPVTVSADIKGNAYASVKASASASYYLGIKSALLGSTAASFNAGAYVTTKLDAFAGISGVLGVGVTASFKLIDVEAKPVTSNKAAFASAGSSPIQWKNEIPVTLSTMGGNVSVYAQISPWVRPTQSLISWTGFTTTTYLLNESGSDMY
ncbi:MAG: hypothetical protein EOO73_27690 [Myxococcales bacterium]|nr:MAG: hypothetical protein EOO73_27690 [Myxococcales bacterium]